VGANLGGAVLSLPGWVFDVKDATENLVLAEQDSGTVGTARQWFIDRNKAAFEGTHV